MDNFHSIDVYKIFQILNSNNKQEILKYEPISDFIYYIYDNDLNKFIKDSPERTFILLIGEMTYSITANKKYIIKNIPYILKFLKYMKENVIYIDIIMADSPTLYFKNGIKNIKLLEKIDNNLIYGDLTNNKNIYINLPTCSVDNSKIKNIFSTIFSTN